MEKSGITFDEWAQSIESYVRTAFPQARARRAFDDVYRWTYQGKECQVHAVSETSATFIALCREQRAAARQPECISICPSTQSEVAARIIGWFAS
jgi:hypothetical protein